LSSYEVSASLAPDSPNSRTIQRVRKRLQLPRLRKRNTPSFKSHRFTVDEKKLIRKTVEMKLYLGPYRLAWDLQNQYGLRISPSTVRRVKRAIMNERHPPPAAPIWRFYERNHPHSLWHGDFFEKVTLFDVGFFNKQVGPMWNDNTAVNGSTLNQVIPIAPFNVTNLFFNFTLKNGSRFDQTKFRLSFNNLFDQHNITNVTQVVKGPIYTPGPGDTLGMLPGRSITLTITFGYSPKGR
jgi:hypothetical protein